MGISQVWNIYIHIRGYDFLRWNATEIGIYVLFLNFFFMI